tara:strand:+ start:36 stop:1667 length:1632 start_codon:yes stop_codon:yes gene_type:complete
MSPVIADGREVQYKEKNTLFDYADSLEVRVPTSCGRTGECHECIVEIRNGMNSLNLVTEQEKFLRGNYRLACRTTLEDSHATVEFATLRRQPRILSKSIPRKIQLDPRVTKKNNNVVVDGKVIDKYRGGIFGIAGDIGTTTVVLNLVDLESGEIIQTSSFENPQRFGGGDVMNRISYDGGDFQGELKQVMLSSINFEIGAMTRNPNRKSLRRRCIYDVVLVGNTTMRDLLFGIDVQSVGQKPYKSLIQTEFENKTRESTAVECSASNIGLRVHPDAKVYSGPLVGSHVGTDVAADMLAIGMDTAKSPRMLVDIGTNTEVVIGDSSGMVTASCPAGPAFEGGEVTYGMPGYDGAVEAVSIREGKIKLSTIGDADVEGICGSGLVDLLSELRRTEAMDELGKYSNESNEFAFAPDQEMYLYRSDISALAQAKSANYSGQFIAMRHFGKSIEDLETLYLAGGFANYINADNAKSIGFIADFPTEKISKVGNASLEGATIMLKSVSSRISIEQLVRKVEHIELETTPDFFDIFVEGCMFKPMPREIF